MLSRRAAALLLAIVGVVLTSGNVYESLRRSGIPLSLEGRVETEEVRREKHPGVDDVHLVRVDGETVHVDAYVAGLVAEGDELRKDAWSATLAVDGTPHDLVLSSDARGMFVVMPLLVLVLTGLLTAKPRSVASPGNHQHAAGEVEQSHR